MEYKASLDTLAKIITASTVILFLFIGYRSVRALSVSHSDSITLLIHGGLLLILFVTLLVCFLYSPRSYKVDNVDLTIVRPANNKKIKLTDISEIRAIAEGEMTGTVRTFGDGGLFGYYGKYYNSKIGSMTLYATQKQNRILITTKQGKKIVITPDDLSIIDYINDHLHLKS